MNKKTKLTDNQLFLKDLISVIETHGLIADIGEARVFIHDKKSREPDERAIYESLLHTLKCAL